MKWLGKKVLSVIGLALALTLAAALFPYIKTWVGQLLPQGRYDRFTAVIAHEMEKTGELTAVRYTDSEIMEATTKALLIGEVQNVKVPYTYEIGLGIYLDQVVLTAGEGGVTVGVPKVRMLYDSFRVTGSPEVKSFFYELSEKRYQEMVDRQAADCRAKYLQDEVCMQTAWQAACDALKKLFFQWAGEEVPLSFRMI